MKPLAVAVLAVAVLTAGHVNRAVAASGVTARMTMKALDGGVVGELIVTNTGGRPVQGVRAVVNTGERQLAAGSTAVIAAGERWVFVFYRPLPGRSTGHLPYVAEIGFHDEGLYPHSTLVGGALSLGDAPPPRLVARVDDIKPDPAARLAVDFRIAPPVPERVRVQVYLPRALAARNLFCSVVPSPAGYGQAAFPLEARASGIRGRYPVHCLLVYEEDGIPMAVTQTATATLQRAPSFWADRRRHWVAALAVLLGAGWGGVAVRGVCRRRQQRIIELED